MVAKDDDDELIIRHNLSVQQKRILLKSGVPHTAFLRAGYGLNLDECVARIESDLPRTKLRKVGVPRQLRMLERIYDNPLHGSYLFAISGYPSDLRARNVALAIMARAMDQYYKKKVSNKSLIKRTAPMWHNVMGGFKDKLLDNDNAPLPSMLIIANITEDSTQVKLEKVRDLLVKFDSIPRIIVTAQIDPLTFVLGKLKHPCDAYLYVGPDDKDLDV